MTSFITNIANAPQEQSFPITPKKILGVVKSVTKKVDKCFQAFRDAIDTLGGIFALAKLPDLPAHVTLFSTGLGLFSIVLLPFEIAKFGKKVNKVLESESIGSFVRSSLDAIAGAGSTLSKLVSPFKILHALKVIKSLPIIPFLNYVFLPCTILATSLDAWDLLKKGRTFWVLQSGSFKLGSNEEAVQQLDRLQKQDLESVQGQLELPDQCKLAERVDSLREKLIHKEKGALDEVKQFYAKLRARSVSTVALGVLSTGLGVGALAAEIAVVVAPLIGPVAPPVLIGIGVGAGFVSLASFSVWVGKKLFMRNDIFDPNAKSFAESVVHTIKQGAVGLRNLFRASVSKLIAA